MKYWLMKSEPGDYSWADLERDGKTPWDGVRNYQARANMMAMKMGDRCFFYHSVNEKRIMGIGEVVKEHYPDPSDASGKFCIVDIVPIMALSQPVTLAEIKATPELQELALVRQSRLSVMPVDEASWNLLCTMGNVSR